eukprot:COSAG04_NODE_1828_length_5472_cov_50.993179_3_plen_121_part_00
MEEEGQSSKRGRAGEHRTPAPRARVATFTVHNACPVAGGKDAKKQKLGDGTLPQSMLSNYLRKGEQLPPSLPSWSCIISARALRPPSAERSDCCCQVRPSLRPNLPRRQKPQQRTSTKSN